MAEISDKEISFLDTTVFKDERFNKQAILDIRTHYTHFSSCLLLGVEKGLSKGLSAKSFLENITQFKTHLRARDYHNSLVERITSEVKFSERKSALQQGEKKILPFLTTYHPAVPNCKNILISKWQLIKNQPLLREIYKDISTSIWDAFGLSTLYSILGIGACSFLLTAG